MKVRNLVRRENPTAYWRTKGAQIGKGSEIYPTAILGSEPYLIRIGENVRITNGVRFITHDGGAWVLRNLKQEYQNIDIIQPIKIGNNVHVGINAVIMPGVNIGSNCIIGCGAIVTKDIPDNSIAVGIPAKVIETIAEYEQKHKDDFLYTKNMPADEKRRYLINLFNEEIKK